MEKLTQFEVPDFDRDKITLSDCQIIVKIFTESVENARFQKVFQLFEDIFGEGRGERYLNAFFKRNNNVSYFLFEYCEKIEWFLLIQSLRPDILEKLIPSTNTEQTKNTHQ